MVRNSRNTLRLFFLLVIAGALFGAWFASSYWQMDLTTMETPTAVESTDWLDTAAIIGEEALQFILGWTGSGQ